MNYMRMNILHGQFFLGGGFDKIQRLSTKGPGTLGGGGGGGGGCQARIHVDNPFEIFIPAIFFFRKTRNTKNIFTTFCLDFKPCLNLRFQTNPNYQLIHRSFWSPYL